MLASMTAFAREIEYTPWGQIIFELRSVNHRYLEINFRLPEVFHLYEHTLRQLSKNYIKRGKLEVFLAWIPNEKNADAIQINPVLVDQLAKAIKTIAQSLDDHPHLSSLKWASLTEILNWPGVLSKQCVANEALKPMLFSTMESALKKLAAMRKREGQGLQAFIQTRLDQIKQRLSEIKQLCPKIQQRQREKLQQALSELNTIAHSERLDQEIVILLQKMDIAEELHRLSAHITEVEHVLKLDESIGRRLDFLMQELNREINTLASKSMEAKLTSYSVDIKVHIEQMREQVQNIE